MTQLWSNLLTPWPIYLWENIHRIYIILIIHILFVVWCAQWQWQYHMMIKHHIIISIDILQLAKTLPFQGLEDNLIKSMLAKMELFLQNLDHNRTRVGWDVAELLLSGVCTYTSTMWQSVDYVTILYEPVDRIVCDKLMLVQNLSAGVGQEVTTREIAEPIVDNKFHHRGGDLVVNLVRFWWSPNRGASCVNILLGIPVGLVRLAQPLDRTKGTKYSDGTNSCIWHR